MEDNERNLLEVKNLAISFKSEDELIPTIKGVSLNVNKRETISIVGESGSGKTVTVRSMMGLVSSPPAIYTGGQILFNNTNLLNYSAKEWRSIRGNDISMVFQDPMTSLNPVMTIGKQMENVYLYQGKKSVHSKLAKSKKKLKKEARVRSIELLEKMSLPDPAALLKRYPFELSGGMRQRIIIALALIHTPKLLIADEPGTALDVTVQSKIIKELKRLVTEEGISMIFITHNLGVAKEVGERTYVMQYGEIVEDGSTEEVFLNPQHTYTKKLLRALPKVTGKHEPVISKGD